VALWTGWGRLNCAQRLGRVMPYGPHRHGTNQRSSVVAPRAAGDFRGDPEPVRPGVCRVQPDPLSRPCRHRCPYVDPARADQSSATQWS
jgi:hypothetical protein